MHVPQRGLPFRKAELLCKIESLAAESMLMRSRERKHISQARRMRLRNRLIDAMAAGELTQTQTLRYARRVLGTIGMRELPNFNLARESYVKAVNALRRNGIHVSAEGKVRGVGFPAPVKVRQEWIDDHDRDYFSLRGHRVGVLRMEARAALLAYAFLRGDDYAAVENKTHISDGELAHLLSAMTSIAARFRAATCDVRDWSQRIERWCQEAREHAKRSRASAAETV